MTYADFAHAIAREIDQVFALNPELPDHRQEHPWLTGWLGDPASSVWLIAENPSATQVDRAHSATSTVETQWSQSRGDRLLRETLVDTGLKGGGAFEPGGWRCYLTDVMKSEVYVTDWHGTSKELKDRVADAWAPVLRAELRYGSPELIVALGGNAHGALRRLERTGALPTLPLVIKVHHYSYVMHRPAGSLGPGHPERQREWKDRIAALVSPFSLGGKRPD